MGYGLKLSVGDLIAMFVLIIVLGVTGAAIFVWKALQGWQDMPGVVVGVIFVVVTALQIAITVAFWRMSRSAKFSLAQHENGIEIKPLRDSDGPKKAV